MGRSIAPHWYDVEVVVHADGSITYAGPDVSNNHIHIDSALSIIVLTLVNQGGITPAPAFATFPLQWMTAGGEPEGRAPAVFRVARESDRRVTIMDVNTVKTGENESYSFLPVVYIKKTFRTSKDPTIINKEPPNIPV